MKNIIPKDSRYLPIVQQKSCCVPACISMIMYKHKIPLIPQELLGYHLGLVVARENKRLFWHPRSGRRPPGGFGTQMARNRYEPNRVFRKLKIPLKAVFHSIHDFDDAKFKLFLGRTERQDKDVLVCFDHNILNGSREKVHQGHLCVVDRVYLSKNQIRLIDPSPNRPKWRIVRIDQLIRAMRKHWIKSGGFWEFEVVES